MRVLIAFIGFLIATSSCTPEFVPQSLLEEDPNAIISPTQDPNGRTGEVEASFLSSEHSFTVTNSIMPNDTVFRVSYVTTSKNFDVFKWVFEGGTTSVGSTTTVSGTTTVEGNIDDPQTNAQIAVLVEYDRIFDRYDMQHAVANADNFDIISIKDYVTFEYQDDLKMYNDTIPWGWRNPQEGWFGPSANSTVTFEPCANAMVGYYIANGAGEDEISRISKDFSNFGTSPKNLVFEYKMEFLVLPNNPDNDVKVTLGYTPIVSGSGSITIEPGELWSDSSYDVTEFKQVVIPLPIIPNFRLSFDKHPSVLNSLGQQRYPFSVCIRNLKIIPGTL
jgi:hypothetical protein